METAIYHDFEPRKRKRAKKREEEAPIGASSKTGGNGARDVGAVPAGGVQESVQAFEETVTVLRRCANPRMLLCVCGEPGAEHRALVRVKRNANFTPGMTFKAGRPVRETEPWEYDGRLPRFRRRW